MLIPRVFPVMLISGSSLVNTVNFKFDRYLGDPLNAIKIFNEKEVDEILVLDITKNLKEPRLEILKRISKECRMPITYGGSINSAEEAEEIIKLGFEKVSICTSYLSNKEILDQTSNKIGSQSVALTLNIKRNIFNKNFSVISHKLPRQKFPLDVILRDLSNRNFGELILNCIDNDGTSIGFNNEVIKYLKDFKINQVVSIIGGASKESDFLDLQKDFPYIGFGASSYFVYQGKMKSVLLSYKHPFREV